MSAKSRTKLGILIGVLIIIIVAGAYGYQYYTELGTSASMQTSQTAMQTVSETIASTTASPLILYSADAYVLESSALASAFTSSTGIMVAPPKGGGSLLLARQISQGNPVSVFIAVSRSAMQPTYLGNQSSGWAIAFASDQMVLAYSNSTSQNSAAASVLNEYNVATSSNSTQAWANFYNGLTSGGVKVGIGDPNADPAGFRAWIVLEAASNVYSSGNFFVNRMITNKGNVTGASAADLIAPLETGQIQFLFIYKSAAIAHNLNYLQLADGVNLGHPAYSSFYSQFSYQLAKGPQKGGLIALYITVPADSTDTANSLQFVVFVVKNYQTVLSPFGLAPMTPPKLYNSTTVPQPIQELVSQGYLKYSGTL